MNGLSKLAKLTSLIAAMIGCSLLFGFLSGRLLVSSGFNPAEFKDESTLEDMSLARCVVDGMQV